MVCARGTIKPKDGSIKSILSSSVIKARNRKAGRFAELAQSEL
jgi:hypothetical protein